MPWAARSMRCSRAIRRSPAATSSRRWLATPPSRFARWRQFGVPQPLAQLVTYMMAKNPAVRYQSAAIVAEQIAAFVDPNVLYAQPPQPPATLAGFEQLRAAEARGAGRAEEAGGNAGGRVRGGDQLPARPLPPAALGRDRDHLPSRPTATASPAGASLASRGAGSEGRRADARRNRCATARSRAAQDADRGLVGAVRWRSAGIIAINMLPPSKPNADGHATRWRMCPSVMPEAAGDHRADRCTAAGDQAVARKTNGPKSLPPTTTGDNTPPERQPRAIPRTRSQHPRPADVGFQQEVLPDDGNLLWASPTTGEPVSFPLVPPEAAGVPGCAPGRHARQRRRGHACCRPSDRRLPPSERKLGNASRIQARRNRAAHDRPAQQRREVPADQLRRQDQGASRADRLAGQVGQSGRDRRKDRARITPAPHGRITSARARGRAGTFLMGEARDVKEVAKAGGAPPQLFRDMERLRRTTDADRHVTLLFFPQFSVQRRRRAAVCRRPGQGPPAAVVAAGRQPAGGGRRVCTSATSSISRCGCSARSTKSRTSWPSELKDRLNQVPRSLEDYFVAAHAACRIGDKLAFRYPGMIRDLHENLRIGVESEQAVVNSVLPARGRSQPGARRRVARSPPLRARRPLPPPPRQSSYPRRSKRRCSSKRPISFDRSRWSSRCATWRWTCSDLAKGAPFEFEIKIIGEDLRARRLTRNQIGSRFQARRTSRSRTS